MRRKPWFLVLLMLTLLVNFLPVNSRAEGTFYQPLENADMDYYDASSHWSFCTEYGNRTLLYLLGSGLWR